MANTNDLTLLTQVELAEVVRKDVRNELTVAQAVSLRREVPVAWNSILHYMKADLDRQFLARKSELRVLFDAEGDTQKYRDTKIKYDRWVSSAKHFHILVSERILEAHYILSTDSKLRSAEGVAKILEHINETLFRLEKRVGDVVRIVDEAFPEEDTP